MGSSPAAVIALLLLLAAAEVVYGARNAYANRLTRQGDALNLLRKKGRQRLDTAGMVLNVEVLTSRVMTQEGSKENDRIERLPGQPEGVNFSQYGGYITVDAQAGRALYYYFVEAPDAASRPLLLWLNGGPGCSSIGFGAMEELGPFRVMSDGKTLYQNPYAWNQVANVLFLESPAGVGFSYSNTTSDYDMSGDARAAEDSYVFMLNWLTRFSNYKNSEFYIAGESYAGHYVPQLAHQIHLFNQINGSHFINLKGIIIGNAVINDLTDDKGMYDFFWNHAFTSDETHRAMKRDCDFSYQGGTENSACQAAMEVANEVFYDLDIYNIYGPLCFDGNLTRLPRRASIREFDPCTDYYVDYYLNDPAVQAALHANVTQIEYRWSACGNLPAWVDDTTTVLPLLQELMMTGYRVWVYSGDNDGRVPITSTRYSINQLDLPVKEAWSPWSAEDEVGGFSITYEGDLTLATVRGAGHEVPSFQAQRALVLIKSFLQGTPLPPYIIE